MEENEQLVTLLHNRGYHISVAESCTGGMVAARLVDVSGASEVFEEGYITYSNRAKEKLLGVPAETIQQFTAVSGEVAREMAEGLHRKTGSELAVSVTGYAGPEDAEDGTKAGTVYIGIWFAGMAVSRKYIFSDTRNRVRHEAAKAALQYALERIKELG